MSCEDNGYTEPIREIAQAVALFAEEVAFESGYEPASTTIDEHCPLKDNGPHAIATYRVATTEDLYEVGDAAIWAEIEHAKYRGIDAWIDFIGSEALIDFPDFLTVRITLTGAKRNAYLDD